MLSVSSFLTFLFRGMEGSYQDQYAAVDNNYYEEYPRWHDGPKTVRGLLAQAEYGPIGKLDLLNTSNRDRDLNLTIFIAHNIPVDYDSANLAFMETSDELWEAIENSRWCEEF